MAGKRINSKSPLTAAEKQSRYRQKKNDEETAEKNETLEKVRGWFHDYIDELSIEGLKELFEVIHYGSKLATLKELSEMSGISVYELKKLQSQGVISPIST